MTEVICAHPDQAIRNNSQGNKECWVCFTVWYRLDVPPPNIIIGYLKEKP